MSTTDRFALPLLSAAQAQKEMTHNEALAALDILVQPVVVAVAPTVVPASPALGACWIVGTGAGGAWAGRAGMLAAWTSGGWRFVAPREGMQAWSLADDGPVRRIGDSWVRYPRGSALAAPTGGTVIDAEARAVIADLLRILRNRGIIVA